MSGRVNVLNELTKRRGITTTAIEVYNVPKGYKTIVVAHPKTGAEASSKFREYLEMGYRPMKEDPKTSPFGIGITDDASKSDQSDSKAKGPFAYLPAYELDNAGNVCLPGKREIVLIAKASVAKAWMEAFEREASERLKNAMEVQGTAERPGFAGATADVAPDEVEQAREALTQEAEAKESKVQGGSK